MQVLTEPQPGATGNGRVSAYELLAIFAAALAIRALFLLAASLETGWSALDLAMLYDGHIYMIIAKSFPTPYLHTRELVPFVTTFQDSRFFLGWFPFYPALIWLASLPIGDFRLSALAVAHVAAAWRSFGFDWRLRLSRASPAWPLDYSSSSPRSGSCRAASPSPSR